MHLVEHEEGRPVWRRSTFCSGANSTCVEVSINGTEVIVRDSKDPDGATLSFTIAEWTAFVAGARQGEFDV